MKHFVDGDQLVITKDDFVDLQESPAVFYPIDSKTAKTILETGSFLALPLGVLRNIYNQLSDHGTEAVKRPQPCRGSNPR